MFWAMGRGGCAMKCLLFMVLTYYHHYQMKLFYMALDWKRALIRLRR